MTNDAGSLPGWRYDSTTRRMRWWDGAQWAERDQQPPPPPGSDRRYDRAMAKRNRPTAKNGYARAATVVLGAVIVGVPALPLLSGVTAVTLRQAGVISVVLTLVGTVLAIAGTVVAVRRPTRKYQAVAAVVLGPIMFIIAVVGLVASLMTPSTIDTTAIEHGIQANLAGSAGAPYTVHCPDSPPDTVGSTFTCMAYDQQGAVHPLKLTVDKSSVVWDGVVH